MPNIHAIELTLLAWLLLPALGSDASVIGQCCQLEKHSTRAHHIYFLKALLTRAFLLLHN